MWRNKKMSAKMIKCSSCGNDVSSAAKACPNCGAKVKKPIYKKWWFWLIIAVVFIAVIGMAGEDDEGSPSSSSGATQSTEAAIVVSADDLIRAYINNSVTADSQYMNKTVTVSGTISSIESEFISIEADSEDLWLYSIYAYYSSSETEKLGSLSKGDKITVTGECKGEGFVGDVEIRYCTIN